MGVLAVRLNVGEALADRTLNGAGSAARTVDHKRGTVGITEIELGKVAVQMLLAAVLIDALHAALEDREATLDGVGIDIATAIFPDRVIDGLVGCELLAENLVEPGLIGDQTRFLGDVRFTTGSTKHEIVWSKVKERSCSLLRSTSEITFILNQL